METAGNAPGRRLRRWMIYNAVGLGGTVVQVAVLALLTHGIGLGLGPATALAVEAAILHNYCGHVRWTWRDRAPASGRGRLVRFNLVAGVLAIPANVVLTAAFAALLGLDGVAANIMAIGSCAMANFIANDRLVF